MANFRAYDITPVLPWDDSTAQDKLYRKILLFFIILGIVLGIVVSQVPYTKESRFKKEAIPERLAKVLVKKKKKKAKPPPVVRKKEIAKAEKKKKKKPKPKVKKKREIKKKPKTDKEKKAREAAKKKLDKVAKELADLQKSLDINLDTKPLKKGGAQAKKADRKLITARGTSGSGGIQVAQNVSADSSGFGGSGKGKALVAMATTQVEGLGDVGGSRRVSPGGLGYRTNEEIRKVFDAKKGLLFSLYSRALRSNPTLQGSILLHLVIAPSGAVTKCEVVSSEIADQNLVRKIVTRVKTFNFGADDVEVWDDKYSIDLFPN